MTHKIWIVIPDALQSETLLCRAGICYRKAIPDQHRITPTAKAVELVIARLRARVLRRIRDDDIDVRLG